MTTETGEKPSLPWYGSPRALLRALLQLNDTPHSIALGSAIGMWIALTPTGGFQIALVMLTALILSPFFRFNRPAAIVMTYVSNPLTALPLWWSWYEAGRLFMAEDMTFARFRSILTPDGSKGWTDVAWGIWSEIGWPLLLGSLIVSTIAGLLTYPFVYWLVRTFHDRSAARKAMAADSAAMSVTSAATEAPTPLWGTELAPARPAPVGAGASASSTLGNAGSSYRDSAR